MHPLHRVGPVERLVEHQDLWVLHERGGHLGALTHPLAEPVDHTIGVVEHPDREQRRIGCGAVGDRVQIGHVADELPGGEAGRNGFVLGDERNAAMHPAVAARVAALDAHRALIHADETGHRAEQGGLAGAVRTEQAGDPRPERAAELGQGHLRAEPDRQFLDDDGRVDRECGVVRTRRLIGCDGGHQRSTHW